MNMHGRVVPECKPVPHLHFNTEGIRHEEQFDAWRNFNGALADLDPITPRSQGFRASADSYHFGSLQLTSFQLSPMSFRYTTETIRRSGLDHWCITAVTRGPLGYKSEDTELNIPAGELILHSFARPFSGVMAETNSSSMFLSRDDFWDIAGHLDKATHQLIRGPVALILQDFLVSLANRASELTVPEASAVGDAFGQLLRAMIVNSPGALEAAQAPIAAVQFDKARRYINANLHSPNLSPDQICANIGISRRQLYYLFEEQGGVATYVRNRRLAACYAALSKSSDGKLVSSIAYEYGFTNPSAFYRGRPQFGCQSLPVK